MDADLRELLQAWPHDPENAGRNFRLVHRSDGTAFIQAREPLGIQQMEYEGRPDGARPEGFDTWLERYKARAARDATLQLETEDCQRLMQEGILFYQRYLILYQMGDWRGVARDTGRNLEYFEFLKERARSREDWMVVEQYRPYVMRMNAVARGRLLLEAADHEGAIGLLRETAARIGRLEKIPTQVFSMESERSIKHLEQVIEEFERLRPEDPLERLRREQREAIEGEDYERAARLRDEIRALAGRAEPQR